MKIQYLVVSIFLLFTLSTFAEILEVLTTDFTPYQYQSENRVEGIATEIVKETIQDAGFQADIKIFPWPRSYKIASEKPGTLIFSIARTKERETSFKWIGTIIPFHVYFYKLKNRKDITVKKLEDAKHYRIGGVFSDIKALELEKLGFLPEKHIFYTSSDAQNINKLFANRIDLMPFDRLSFRYKVEMEKFNFKDIAELIEIPELSFELYLAANVNTPDHVIKKLQTSLEKFKRSEKYKKLHERLISNSEK